MSYLVRCWQVRANSDSAQIHSAVVPEYMSLSVRQSDSEPKQRLEMMVVAFVLSTLETLGRQSSVRLRKSTVMPLQISLIKAEKSSELQARGRVVKQSSMEMLRAQRVVT